MIKSALNDERSRFPSRSQKCGGLVDREGARVMVRMAAFVWMRNDNLRPMFQQQPFDLVREPGQMEARFLVWNFQPYASSILSTGKHKRLCQLPLACLSIFVEQSEAMSAAVLFVFWSAIRHMHKQRREEASQPRSQRHHFIIRMSKDEHRARHWNRRLF